MALKVNSIFQGDCVKGLAQIEAGSVDLAFADPPFNIGYEYDVYKDRRSDEEYLDWTRKWMSGVWRALKPNGTFWLAIGDEYAAELKIIAQKDIGFTCRSWVLWYYTFGVNCKRAFSRSHTHLLYFVKNPKDFTFNADDPAIRVPSARQLVYADTRANPKGRLPDNTWILRPQDVPNGFAPDHDTWYFPRVAGTFKEREGFHGCQMPEQLLGRIIRCCSNPGDIVLDPFGGSGTTFTVAKKLGRQWIGCELSKDYVDRIRRRLDDAKVGDSLDGSANPLSSAPPTSERFSARGSSTPNGEAAKKTVNGNRASHLISQEEIDAGILDAYKKTHAGLSVDHLLADPNLNAQFIEACMGKALPGAAKDWNHRLLCVRKMGKLPRLEHRVRTCTFNAMDPYSHASEIALQQLNVETGATLDEILCDPTLAARFDDIAASFAPGYTPFEYRWAALAIRKRAKSAKRLAKERCEEWRSLRLPRSMPIAKGGWSDYSCPGVYLIIGRNNRRLYVGETLNLRQRIDRIESTPAWQKLKATGVKIVLTARPYGLQSYLIHRLNPVMNLQLLIPDFGNVA